MIAYTATPFTTGELNIIAHTPVIHTATKPKRLIELAAEEPYKVLTEVFDKANPARLQQYLRDWFYVSLTHDNSPYAQGEQRGAFISFYMELPALTETLFVITIQHTNQPITTASRSESNSSMQLLRAFYEHFPVEYIRRELWHWLEAGINNPGPWPDNMNESEVLRYYDLVSCLLEAGWYVSKT